MGGEPGAKQNNPRANSPQDTKRTSLLRWPAMRAHPTWQRPILRCHISRSFFVSFSFDPLRHKHLACYMFSYLAAFISAHGSLEQHLLDLIIIESSSNNYQYKETSSREAPMERIQATTSLLPRPAASSTPARTEHAPTGPLGSQIYTRQHKEIHRSARGCDIFRKQAMQVNRNETSKRHGC